MVPASVSLTKNLNASKTWSVPSHMYLDTRGSSEGLKESANLARIAEFRPSAASTRS